jgi:hypothetical protein
MSSPQQPSDCGIKDSLCTYQFIPVLLRTEWWPNHFTVWPMVCLSLAGVCLPDCSKVPGIYPISGSTMLWSGLCNTSIVFVMSAWSRSVVSTVSLNLS